MIGLSQHHWGEVYQDLTRQFGRTICDRVEAPATRDMKGLLAYLTPQHLSSTSLAGVPIQVILTHAPGNDAAIGGLKVVAENGWFAARLSGTEDIFNIYAESFLGSDHLPRIIDEAQDCVSKALDSASAQAPSRPVAQAVS